MISAFRNAKQEAKVLASYDEVLKLWEADYESRFIPTQYGSTHVLLFGDRSNPPLMLFHGVGDNSALMWALNSQALSEHFYCIAVDTLGGPGKSVPGERYTKKDFDAMSWLDEVREQLGLEQVYAAGVSNGAYIAYRYAAARPETVIKAVCLEGGMVESPLKSMLGTIAMMFPEMLWPTSRNLRNIVHKLSSPNSDVFRRYPLLAEHLVLLMQSHSQSAMFPHNPQKYASGEAASLRDKLYFLVGDHHAVVGRAFLRLLKREGLNYKVIPGAGHAINHEQPEAVHREIILFLEDHSDGARPA